MEIKQLQVGYNDAQDRMVLRINIDADKFANILLTRRVCRFILDQTVPFLKLTDAATEPSSATKSPQPAKRPRKKSAEASTAVLPDRLAPARGGDESNQDKPAEDVAKPDYKTPFEDRKPEGNIFGIGSAWPVAVNAGCSQQDNKLSFTLQFENQQTMNLTLSQLLAKGLFRLMYDLAERIQWFGGIALTPQADPTEERLDTPAPRNSVTYH